MSSHPSNNDRVSIPTRRWLCILALVTAGEAIFFLPFVLPRVFRPTLLDVFGLTNFELGLAFSLYGVTAMIAYFPGGPLADWFDSRKLMAVALVTTAIGGLVMAAYPSVLTLKILYAYWGLTTILLFWAPLIRETRVWGGERLQGRAFGLLDGGRGLVAALIASSAVWLFSVFMPDELETTSLEWKRQALRQVIFLFAGITFGSAIFIWIAIPRRVQPRVVAAEPFRLRGMGKVLAMPTVWLQSLVVVCAYVGYKGLDDVSLYARDVLRFDDVAAARTSTLSMWIRPVAAIAAGFLADRYGAARMSIASMLVFGLGCLSIAVGMLRPGMTGLFLAILVSTSAAVFALRGLYFALMQEARVPLGLTGTAVGIVSVIGYTPDVFMGPLTGYLLDRWPGEAGHQWVFAVLSVAAFLGLIVSMLFWRLARQGVMTSPGA
ncbi:MAG: MFS transporter [Planctomycetota bacterium]